MCCRCVAACCSALQCVAVYYSFDQVRDRISKSGRHRVCCRCVADVLQMCCSVVLIRSSTWQDIKGWSTSSVLQICCSVLQCVAVCCSVLQCVAACCKDLLCVAVRFSVLQGVAGCCCVLQRVAACCSVLQHVAACCSILLIRSSARQDIKEWSISSIHLTRTPHVSSCANLLVYLFPFVFSSLHSCCIQGDIIQDDYNY